MDDGNVRFQDKNETLEHRCFYDDTSAMFLSLQIPPFEQRNWLLERVQFWHWVFTGEQREKKKRKHFCTDLGTWLGGAQWSSQGIAGSKFTYAFLGLVIYCEIGDGLSGSHTTHTMPRHVDVCSRISGAYSQRCSIYITLYRLAWMYLGTLSHTAWPE